jgi:pimeloyl-ACP methyl ester carboxylesterase
MRRARIAVLTLLGAVLLTAALVHAVAAASIPPTDQPPPQDSPTALAQAPGPRPAAPSGDCYDGVQDSGAKYRICLPAGEWSDLIVYAHGYVAPNKPVEIPEDQMSLPGFPLSVDQIVNDLMGCAFATTSYYTNGLAVLPAISDLRDLVHIFTSTHGIPEHIYLAGVSEGGLITALSVEQYPDVYHGGLAMCGPYGDFYTQLDHFGDFRVVFDYFFPGLMPGTAISMPDHFLETWESGYFSTTIEPIVSDPVNSSLVDQLLNVTGVSPYEYDHPTSTASIEEVLGYNAFATNDGIAKLGGQPFDNQERWYSGSDNDELLNDPELGVARFSAEPGALDEIEANYQTTGELSVPLVTMHTTGDEVVPYWHVTEYRIKVILADNIALHRHIEVQGHGHCAFGFADILGAYTALVDVVENPPPYQPVQHAFLPLTVRTP